MPKFTYPVVFIFNEETQAQTGYIPDVAIFSAGETPEDVYAELEEVLKHYIKFSLKHDTEIPTPTSLDDITKKWKGYKVSLITAEI